MKKIIVSSMLLIPFFVNAFGTNWQKLKEQYEHKMEQMKYKVKYINALSKIKVTEHQLNVTQDSNRYYEFKNLQIEPLQVLAHTFEDLASVDYHSNPTWINTTYNKQKESYDKFIQWNDRSSNIKNRLYSNYKALINYTDNQLTDSVTRDTNDFVRVNNERLINQ